MEKKLKERLRLIKNEKCIKFLLNIFLNIIKGIDKISLRIIDWFVTNYSKTHIIQYYNNNKQFNDHT